MPALSDEQISKARSVTLLEYFEQHDPACIKRQKNGRCVHKDHDSFVISNGKDNRWFWNSRGIGGASALDYLIKIEGMSFRDAVDAVTQGSFFTSSQIETKLPKTSHVQKEFKLPPPAKNNDNVTTYLKKRGISSGTINRCISKGLLYESANGSCVFVGRDNRDGRAKFAAQRSTKTDAKADVTGSDKRFGFCLPPDGPGGANTVFVFESPIDALAHYEIEFASELLTGAFAHDEIGDIEVQDGFRLSLSGIAPVALYHFLEQNPQITTVCLCLDNDDAGREAASRFVQALRGESEHFKLPHGKRSYDTENHPPPHGKDYADTLKILRSLNEESARDMQEKKAARAAFSH
ncbi:MAG: DUF3991 and toprim domain-containing protein [Defluviitaleaceae bacterium]|nr:DUF3991 and toprim domain-containing protein [Defluviitaleaceae bacterium]